MSLQAHVASLALKQSWYSLTFCDDEEEDAHGADHVVEARDSCNVSVEVNDANSDVSTDVGEEEEYRSEFGAFEHDCDMARAELAAIGRARTIFLKANKQQRIGQLRRICGEFTSLEFDSVDALSQEGIVMRMLAILKTLNDSTIYYNEGGRSEESNLSLLGLNQHKEVFEEVALRAECLCEYRQFRSAFDVLKEAVAHICVEAPHQRSAEEMEAMNLRRLKKRQRQREERREQRRQDRKNRSAQRWNSFQQLERKYRDCL